MEATKKQKIGNWDTIYSSFYWQINLNRAHEFNTAEKLTGYSKRVGESENQNKDLLLKRKIVNLLLNGYFNRMNSIEIFQRTEFCIDKKRDPKIIILYPTHFDLPELNKELILKKYGAWLKQLYDFIQQKKDVRDLLPANKKPVSKEEFLNINRYHFTSVAQLYSHAARLLVNGHAEGQVNHFINSYKQLKNW